MWSGDAESTLQLLHLKIRGPLNDSMKSRPIGKILLSSIKPLTNQILLLFLMLYAFGLWSIKWVFFSFCNLLARLGSTPRFHLPPSPSPSKKMMISPQFSTYGCFAVFEWVISSLCSFQVASGCSLIVNAEHQILCCVSVLIVWSLPIHFIFIHSYCIFFVRISTFSCANIDYFLYYI